MARNKLFHLAPAVAYGALLALAACSSSFGSGGSSSPSRPGVVVLPSGERIVCADGSAPPCH
jgi:hypothetical protein